MIALTKYDKCYAINGLERIFNSDGVKRTSIDIDEVRRSLDFAIVKKPSFDFEGRQIPGHFHLVREDTNQFIPSTGIGANFKPVQHLEVFDHFCDKIMSRFPTMELEAAGTIHGCGNGITMAKLGSDFCISGDESPNSTRIMVANRCNGYGSLLIGCIMVRFFCQNQIPVAMSQARNNGFSFRHTENAKLKFGDAVEMIAASLTRAQEIRKKSELMARINVTPKFLKHILDTLYPFKMGVEKGTAAYTRNENRRNEIINQFESGETAETIKTDTAWKVFNALTYNIYNPTTTKKSVDLAEVAYTGAVGLRGEKVGKIHTLIYNEALKMAA